MFGLHRDLFAELGGFCEDFDGYGGEDWELAHRAWVAGAVLAHVPEAVAWHDGPDWAGRGDPDERRHKNAETVALTRLLPDPVSRGGGQWLPYPAVAVRCRHRRPAAALATARSAFAGDADCGVWLPGADAEPPWPRWVTRGSGPADRAADVRARALVAVELDRPAGVDVAALARSRAAARAAGHPAGTCQRRLGRAPGGPLGRRAGRAEAGWPPAVRRPRPRRPTAPEGLGRTSSSRLEPVAAGPDRVGQDGRVSRS